MAHGERLPELVSPRTIDIEALPRPEQRQADSQLHYVLLVLRRRWRLCLAFTAAGFAFMALVSLIAPRRYTAVAVLHVSNEPPHVTNIPQVVAPPTYFEGVEFFQDQAKILESRSLAARVIREEGLEHEPAFADADDGWPILDPLRRFAVGAITAAGGWLARDEALGAAASTPHEPILGVSPGLVGRYGKWLEIQPITNSRLIEVRFTSPSPVLSQRIANAHTRNYIRQALESKFELTGEARRFLDREIERVRGELTRAEAALNAFRREHPAVAVDERENVVVERLADLGRRLTAAEADRIAAEAEFKLVEGRERDALPSVLTNPLIQGLKQEVSRLEVRHAEQAEIFVPGSSQIREIDSQLRSARTRLTREIDRAVSGIESAYLAAVQREQALRSDFESQQASVLDAKALIGQYVRLDQAVTTNRNLYGTLLQRQQETDVVKGVQLSNASVMDPAELPGMPSQPAVPFNLAFGLLFGCVLGVGVSFTLEHLDRSLQTPEDVQQELSLPTLGVVPDFTRVRLPGASWRGGKLLRAAGGHGHLVPQRSPTLEAYRSLRTSVLFLNPERPPRSLLVTSSQPREGKTSTTVNMALCVAQLSRGVVVVDADMRHPSCHRALGVGAGSAGLSDVLRGRAGLEQVIQRLAVHEHGVRPAPEGWSGRELHLLPAGAVPSDPAALLTSPQMDQVLQTLFDHYDLVLIDSPPVFPITDSATLAPRVDGVVLVVRGHITDRQISRDALARLRYMKANVVGVVLNGIDPGSTAYHSYSYYFTG